MKGAALKALLFGGYFTVKEKLLKGMIDVHTHWKAKKDCTLELKWTYFQSNSVESSPDCGEEWTRAREA